MEQGEGDSLRSKRLSNVGRAMLGNAGGARSTREGKPCLREAKVLENNIEYT